MTHTLPNNLNRNFDTVSGNKTKEDACHHIGFRVTASEKQELLRLAGRKPLSRFIRDTLLDGIQRTRKAYRKPKRDDVLLGKVLAALGHSRLSSNLNQIARASNRGALPVTEELCADLQSACLDVRAMRMALMMALGFQKTPSEQGE